MIDLLPTIPPAPATAANEDAEWHMIGVALVGSLRGLESPIATALFAESLAARLVREGVQVKGVGGLTGGGFMCCVVEVRGRDRALLEIEEALTRAGFWPGFELAYYDAGDLAWRTVYPQPAQNFGRFLSPEALSANARLVALQAQAIALLMEAVKMGQTG